MKESEERLIAIRRAKVADLLAKGYNQAEIAKACVTSEPTISRDVDFLRKEATAQMEEYVSSLPLEHKKVRQTVDLVLVKCFEMLEAKDAENTLEVMKLILSANELRSSLLGDVTAIDKARKYAESLEKQIAVLKKESQPTYEIVMTEHPASGKKGQIERKVVRKSEKKASAFTPVV